MSRQSGLLAAQKAKRAVLLEAAQHVERQMCMDSMQIAARRLGFSYKDILALSKELMSVREEFAGTLDIKNREADYLRIKMDEALGEIVSGHQELIPFATRYPEIRKIDALGNWEK